MKIKITILAIITTVIIGLFMQQTAQGEAIIHNYAGKKLNVTVLGDSYSAGNGANGYEYGPGECHRNSNNWAEIYKRWLSGNGLAITLINRACSGAKTGDFFKDKEAGSTMKTISGDPDKLATNKQIMKYLEDKDVCNVKPNNELKVSYSITSNVVGSRRGERQRRIGVRCNYMIRRQLDNVNTSTDMVMMTIGGNDLGFDDIIKSCFAAALRSVSDCQSKINEARGQFDKLEDKLGSVLSSLNSRLRPDAKIVLLGYPLLALNNNESLSGFPVAKEVRKLGLEGNSRQKKIVNAYNKSIGQEKVIFIDNIPQRFSGHEPDASIFRKNHDRWIHEFFEPSAFNMNSWYHPNFLGHSSYMSALRERVPLPNLVKPIVRTNGDIDIVFVVDTTGSMSGSIYAVKNNIQNIVSSVNAKTKSARFALVTYRDHPSHGGDATDYPSRIETDFTNNIEVIKQAASSMRLGDGGDWEESVYSGMRAGLDLQWRAGVKKMMIVIGDAPAKDPEPVTGLTKQSIVNAAYAVDPAQVYVIDTSSDYSLAAMKSLAEQTGGEYARANNAGSELVDYINASIENVASKPNAWINRQYVAKVGETLELDGAGSYSTSGKIVKYEWDVDQDGVYDMETDRPFADYTFTKEFSGLLTLRVTDSNGLTNVATTTLTVSDDGDEHEREFDNCPDAANPDQADYDKDGIGDVCDSDPGYLEEYGYYQILKHEKNQARKNDNPKKDNTGRRLGGANMNRQLKNNSNKKEVAVRTPDDKTSELQKNDSLDVKKEIEGEKKRDSKNKDESPWVKIVLAVAIVIAAIAGIVFIKVYRRKTSSS